MNGVGDGKEYTKNSFTEAADTQFWDKVQTVMVFFIHSPVSQKL
jgi:hypothetical protein